MNLTPAQKVNIAAVAREVRRCAPMNLATNYGATVSGTDGGFAVPVDMAKAILMPAVGALLPHCSELPVTQGGSIGLPTDFATPYAENGVVAAWEDEAAQLPQIKPRLDLDQFHLKKLVALVPVTDQLLEDSSALAAYLPVAMQNAVTRRVNDAILSGLGGGRPLGILNSGALITVAKAAGQTAGTIVDANIGGMLERSLSPLTSLWVANPAAYSQIIGLSKFDGASRTIAGLPLILSDSCPALGQPGDITLADMSMYIAATKNPQLHGSAHLWFDQDMTAFRLVFRMDGHPAIAAPITPPNAGATKSPFITVAARV